MLAMLKKYTQDQYTKQHC